VKLSLDSKQEWEIESDSNQRSYGNLVHDILAKVESIVELPNVLEEYHLKGAITSSEKEELIQKLDQLLKEKSIAKLFAKGINTKREANLITAEGELLRPDRVCFLEEKIVILDYKTGEENQSYFKQLKRYQNEISKTSDLPVEAFILYTELEKVVEVA
jgi:ATP-dependent exoDNAse (exonuclease V) beta subunit